MRIDADPADDRLDPDSGCPIPPEPEDDADREFQEALAAFYEARDELEEQRRTRPEQLRLF